MRGTRRKKGFTFLEIMMVVVIIGILMSIAIPQLTGKSKKARINAAKFQIGIFKTALGNYEMDVGEFPSTSQGLKALVDRPSEVAEEDWDGPYMDKIPKDPFNQEYIFRSPGEHSKYYDLASKGPDKQEGTEDDITNWASDDE
jgi:general secretion pathway protein G